MKTSLQFRNFDGLDHIKDFTEETITHSLGKFESWHDFDVHMVMGTFKHRSDSHRPVFECELMIQGRGMPRSIVVKKIDSDFYKAVRASLKSAEKILRRDAKIRISKRRQGQPETAVETELEAITE